MSTTIAIENGPITRLTLSSNNGLNLLHGNTIREFHSIMETLHKDDRIQVLIITGGNQKAFSAGANIEELVKLHDDIPAYVHLGEQLMESIFHFPSPVIAAINGYALGAGFSLAMACELRLMADTAKMGQLAVRNALIPPFGDTQRLIQTMGSLKAKELIYTGKILNAQEAQTYGLINNICPLDSLQQEADHLAQIIAESPAYVLRMVKDVMNRGIEEGYAVGYLAQEEALIRCLGDPRTKKTLKGFFKK